MRVYISVGEISNTERVLSTEIKALINPHAQVCHHPPMYAMHVEHKDWTLWEEYTVSSKFRGKYLNVFPIGTCVWHFRLFYTTAGELSYELEAVAKFRSC